MRRVLFDSQAWMDANPSDYVADYLDCSETKREDYKSEEELLEAVSNWLYEQSQYDWEDFVDECQHEEGHCLVTGYFMSWMGPQSGGKVYKDLASAVSNILLDDSYPVFSIDENGLLVLNETHHDAPCSGNHYEFRILTAAGEKYYSSHVGSLGRKQMCESLLKGNRSRNVKLKTFYLSKKDFVEAKQ